MIVQLPSDIVLFSEEIVGIFDFDNCTTGKRTLPLLKKYQKEGSIEDSLNSLPRSFILLSGNKEKIILTSTTTSTIRKKMKEIG